MAATTSAVGIAEVQTTYCRVLFNGVTSPCFELFSIWMTCNPTWARRSSAQAVICDREIPNSLTRCRIDGVAERGDKRWDSWLTDARWRSIAVNDVHVRLSRSFVDSRCRVVLKIRLVDGTLGRRNLPTTRNAGAKDRGALELGAGRFRIHDQARIQHRIHARNPHFTLIIDLDFNDRGHICQETAVRGNSDACALAVLALSPARFLGHHLRNMAQAPGFPRVRF